MKVASRRGLTERRRKRIKGPLIKDGNGGVCLLRLRTIINRLRGRCEVWLPRARCNSFEGHTVSDHMKDEEQSFALIQHCGRTPIFPAFLAFVRTAESWMQLISHSASRLFLWHLDTMTGTNPAKKGIEEEEEEWSKGDEQVCQITRNRAHSSFFSERNQTIYHRKSQSVVGSSFFAI